MLLVEIELTKHNDRSMLSPESHSWSSEAAQEFGTNFDDWIDNVQWFDPESIDWVTSRLLFHLAYH
jgi:hypothetical protein